LTPDANICFASDSVYDILGYTPDEVKNKSCFEFFHPDEVPFARAIHNRGLLMDKAAVLHYARILAKNGRYVNCECCFTVVHNVLVASTSIYLPGEKSESMLNIPLSLVMVADTHVQEEQERHPRFDESFPAHL
jgi:PAS domain-containing protein